MSKHITVYDAIAIAIKSDTPVAFTNSDTKRVYQSRHATGCMMFDQPDRQPLSQGQFLEENRYSAMTESDTFEESELDEDGYPDLDDVIEWANDPDTTNEQLQAYLADVAGEDNRKRHRSTNIEKIVDYVEAQK